MSEKITEYLEEFLNKKSLFKDKKSLQSNYIPESITHRDQQIEQATKILAPSLKCNKPSNLFIYGQTGTGKTLSIQHTTNKIMEIAKKNDIPVCVVYINCKLKRVADTEYRLIAQLARELGKEIPPTGLPTDEVYKIFVNAIDNKEQILLFVLDEIDQLVKKAGDNILYNLTRINSELKHAQISVVGISNDLVFADNLDPRVKSSLSEEEILFPPYNALQIQDILKQRSKEAFSECALSEGVIEKCAAYAAREHGDARRALELLRVAGELAEREGREKINLEHIDLADEKLERERIFDILAAQPKQFQAVLYCIISTNTPADISTGPIYSLYKVICKQTGLRPLTQRRVSDIIAELDMLGLINTRVTSKGRYGRTREVSIGLPEDVMAKSREILAASLGVK